MEWTPAVIIVGIPLEQWHAAALWLQGIRLDLSQRMVAGHPHVVADWPRSGVGQYRLRLEVEDSADTRTVFIAPAKLSQIAYARLLTDLDMSLPAAIAFGLQQAGGLSGLTVLPPDDITVAQEFTRLQRAVHGTTARPGLLACLREITSDPHVMLTSDDIWVHRDRVRRPHATHLARALTRGNNLTAEGVPLQVVDSSVEPTVDLYENQVVKLFADQVAWRLRRLSRRLERIESHSNLSQVRIMQVELLQARQGARFLDEVSRTPMLPNRTTMALVKRPPYRAVLEGFLDLHRSLAIRFEDPRLEAPLDHVPALYQLWGTLQVIMIVLGEAVACGYDLVEQHLVHRDMTGPFVRALPPGKVALRMREPAGGNELAVYAERSFGKNGALRSISYDQIPDVTLEVIRPGELPRLYLFDPKYKLAGEHVDENVVGKPTKVDIDKMHAYRDAIRGAGDARVVRNASILYPGRSVSFADGLEAIRSYPGDTGPLELGVRAVVRTALG